MKRLGLPRNSASHCQVWAGFGYRVLYPPTPKALPKWCTSSGVGGVLCPPGSHYLAGPSRPPSPAQVRCAGGDRRNSGKARHRSCSTVG